MKTRSGLGFGSPAEAVTAVKLKRMQMLAFQWLTAHPRPWTELRFDVVSVLRTRDGLVVDHLQGVS